MANRRIAGTPRKLTIDGLTFDVMADSDVTFVVGEYTNENVPTSGKNILKKVKRSEDMTGLTLACNSEEIEVLRDVSNKEDVGMSLTLADGSTWRATGAINIENYTSADAKLSLGLLPTGTWSKF